MPRFPNIDNDQREKPAIKVFGRRFDNGQTTIEYLTEFLLVFASPKDEEGRYPCEFPIYDPVPDTAIQYYPPYRLGLKLFAFLGGSKFETRHEVHKKAFSQVLEQVAQNINSETIGPNQGVALIQGLLSGFIGVSGERTWTAHTFLPAAEVLLAREVMWRHGGSKGAKIALSANAEW